MISYSTQHRLFAIQHDLKRGAVQSAFDRIDVTLKLGVDNAAKAELLYHLADVHDQRGEYAKALGNLSEAFDISHNAELQQNAKLQVATVQFRLGRTTESLRALHWVRKQAAAAGSTDGVFYAVLRSISVLIERDKPQAAKRIARAALDEREKMRPGPKVDCHFSRIAARALVLTEDSKDRAKTLALDAFGVAQRELGERALGNCQYCLGDVYRHRREYAEAESSYRSGLTHAVSNFDLKLYCYLGLAAVAIAKADDDGLRHCLEELSQLPISSHSPEWTIAYMFASIYLSLGHPLGPHVDGFLRDASYGPPSRLWQVKAAELLARRTQKNLSLMEFRRGLGELKIVL